MLNGLGEFLLAYVSNKNTLPPVRRESLIAWSASSKTDVLCTSYKKEKELSVCL